MYAGPVIVTTYTPDHLSDHEAYSWFRAGVILNPLHFVTLVVYHLYTLVTYLRILITICTYNRYRLAALVYRTIATV
jgi:hypothetical protein